MSITAKRYTGGKETEAWDRLVEESPRGTIFHTRRFLSYHTEDRFTDHSLLFFDGDALIAVFPAAEVYGKNVVRILKSHPGASYGGFVTRTELPLEKNIGVINAAVEYAAEHGFTTIELRATESIFHSGASEQMIGAFLHTGFVRYNEEIGTYFDLEDYWDKNDEEIIMSLPQKTRPTIRKGIARGLQFKQLSPVEIPALHALIARNLQKHAAQPTHSKEELIRLIKLFPERILSFGIFNESVLIGGFVLFEITPKKWHIFYSVMDYDYSRLSPLHFGLHRLLSWASSHKYKYLNYGISTENAGHVINWGLLKFKESFGGKNIIRSCWRTRTAVTKNIMIHPDALLETEFVGEGTRIWAFAHIMADAVVGKNCNICDQVFIETGAIIGNNVTIKNNVLIWKGIHIADYVFIGPGVIFTNDSRPRCSNSPATEQLVRSESDWLKQTFVEDGASIGAHSTILPGIRLGKYCMIGAASVVTKDVPPFTLVVGNPARPVGLIDKLGNIVERFQPSVH